MIKNKKPEFILAFYFKNLNVNFSRKKISASFNNSSKVANPTNKLRRLPKTNIIPNITLKTIKSKLSIKIQTE